MNNLMDQRKVVSAILALDEKLLKTFLPEDEHEKVTSSFSYPNCQLNNPHYAALVAKEDIEYVLARGYATLEEIRNWLLGCEEAYMFRSFVDLDKVWISSEIRKDWASALRKTRYGHQLSAKVGFGFSKDDLKELAKLHKANKFRRKIEDLLEDCNFHTESADFADQQYEKYL